MKILFSLAQNTFREAVRDKIFYIFFLFGALLLLAAPLAGQLAAGQEDRIITNFGLTMIHIFGLFLTVFVGSRLIFQEIEKKTIFLLIPKPIPRPYIILGKFLGLSGVLFVVVVLMGALYFLLISPTIPLLLAIVFLYFSFLLLLALVLFFSTFMAPLLAAGATFLLFAVGNITFTFRHLARWQDNFFSEHLANIVYHLLPNFTQLNLKSHVLYQLPYTPQDLLWIVLSTILFILVFLAAAMWQFGQKEFS